MEIYEYDESLGGYVPSIPLPFYGRRRWWKVWQRFGCHCGKYFWRERDYRTHYALNHIEPSPDV